MGTCSVATIRVEGTLGVLLSRSCLPMNFTNITIYMVNDTSPSMHCIGISYSHYFFLYRSACNYKLSCTLYPPHLPRPSNNALLYVSNSFSGEQERVVCVLATSTGADPTNLCTVHTNFRLEYASPEAHPAW